MADFRRGDEVWLGKKGNVGWEVLRSVGDRVVIETVTGRGSQRRTVSASDLTLRTPRPPAVDPKILARRARQAANSRAYRARLRALRETANPSRQAPIVARAVEAAETLRERRADILRQLPDVRNMEVRLRVGERTERRAPLRKSRAGQVRQARAIRDRANAERLQEIGRSRQAELRVALESGPAAERLQETMNREQRRRFQRLSEEIASGSRQSIAILFRYAGGQSLYTEALDRILASPQSRDVEEGLDIMDQLAGLARSAARTYAPSRIGRLNI